MKTDSTRILIAACAAMLGTGCAANRPQTHATTYPSGAPQWQTQLVGGVPEGASITWHENGQVASRGTYRRGVREGEFTYWDERGVLLRRETYVAGERTATWMSETGLAVQGPSMTRPADADVAKPTSPYHYAELRLQVGSGVSTAARRTDEGAATEGQGTGSVGASLLVRSGYVVFGGSVSGGGAIFGANHTYGGALGGVALKDGGTHFELLGEAGMHGVSGLGTGLFTTARGKTEATMPYVGAQARLVIDPGAVKHVVIDLSIRGRRDLRSSTHHIMTETCLLGCSTSSETWVVGGRTGEFVVGIGYQFD